MWIHNKNVYTQLANNRLTNIYHGSMDQRLDADFVSKTACIVDNISLLRVVLNEVMQHNCEFQVATRWTNYLQVLSTIAFCY